MMDTTAALSNLLVYAAIAVYALALLAYAADAAQSTTRKVPTPLAVGGGPLRQQRTQSPGGSAVGRAGTALTVLAFALNLGAVLARGVAAQRAPWGNMYEFATVIALATGAAYLAILAREPVRQLGVWVVSVILLTLGLAVTVLYTPVYALVPVLNSYWLVVHVAAATTAGGVFTLGAAATVLYLVRSRSEERAEAGSEPPRGYAESLLPARRWHRVAHAAHMFAFPCWTYAVLAGALWAETSWGRSWGWDPKETWAFITWVLYAAYLHAESTVGWRGRRAAWLALAGYAAFVFNFFGVNLWISGLHSYAGV